VWAAGAESRKHEKENKTTRVRASSARHVFDKRVVVTARARVISKKGITLSRPRIAKIRFSHVLSAKIIHPKHR